MQELEFSEIAQVSGASGADQSVTSQMAATGSLISGVIAGVPGPVGVPGGVWASLGGMIAEAFIGSGSHRASGASSTRT